MAVNFEDNVLHGVGRDSQASVANSLLLMLLCFVKAARGGGLVRCIRTCSYDHYHIWCSFRGELHAYLFTLAAKNLLFNDSLVRQ
jgi:hypothetical protein